MAHATAGEFALRSLAIEALDICRDSGFRTASISVIMADDNDEEDYDWWKVMFDTNDGVGVQVSTSYGESDVEE